MALGIWMEVTTHYLHVVTIAETEIPTRTSDLTLSLTLDLLYNELRRIVKLTTFLGKIINHVKKVVGNFTRSLGSLSAQWTYELKY